VVVTIKRSRRKKKGGLVMGGEHKDEAPDLGTIPSLA
jgi:hypothetical protein